MKTIVYLNNFSVELGCKTENDSVDGDHLHCGCAFCRVLQGKGSNPGQLLTVTLFGKVCMFRYGDYGAKGEEAC